MDRDYGKWSQCGGDLNVLLVSKWSLISCKLMGKLLTVNSLMILFFSVSSLKSSSIENDVDLVNYDAIWVWIADKAKINFRAWLSNDVVLGLHLIWIFRGSTWVQMSLSSPIEPIQTETGLNKSSSKHDWCECTLLSLQQSAMSGRTLCVKASCLFRFGLEMNLTHPSSLCMVCSDRGCALCEIEVGSRQYPALSVFLSVWKL